VGLVLPKLDVLVGQFVDRDVGDLERRALEWLPRELLEEAWDVIEPFGALGLGRASDSSQSLILR